MSAFPVAVGSGSVGSKLGRWPVKHPPSTTPASTDAHQTGDHPTFATRFLRNGSPKSRRKRRDRRGRHAVGTGVGGEGSAATAAMAASGYGVTLLERDPPRRRHRAAAMGDRRDVVLLVHHPPSHHRARLRLAVARRLPVLRSRRAGGGAAVRCGAGSRGRGSAGVALACLGRAGGVDRPAGRWCQRPTGGVRPSLRAGRGDDRASNGPSPNRRRSPRTPPPRCASSRRGSTSFRSSSVRSG